MPTLLFPAHPVYPYKVDPSFELEEAAAKMAGFNVAYVGLETFFGEDVKIKGLPKESEPILYRGWIVKLEDYQRMAACCLGCENPLIVNPQEYLNLYHFPNWYNAIGGYKVTALSIYKPLTEVSKMGLEALSYFAKGFFGPSGIIVKDYIKSRKHEWYDACYMPSALDMENVQKVIGNFIDRQGESLVGGVVLREFVDFKRIGLHSKSRLPLINEHRFFVFHGKVIYQAPYWSEGDYSGNIPGPETVEGILSLVKSPFYAVDVAELEGGGWTIVELNDGGSAGVPEGGNQVDFYQTLYNNWSDRP